MILHFEIYTTNLLLQIIIEYEIHVDIIALVIQIMCRTLNMN